ncbi:amino acid/amide ABC transporter ATP-binding protein 1, HAAT family (TC 3.A.1.4.-) [Alkalithermobacter thermoalcaliphilus JW-YL-7 = DSM 7308]|uniref:Amino acid/amide ABC transporter ATP-binding protein 1, HAAT family (TC 3.A.1.4.-) n=1 Tax=Alkalithermobacter thermoalcaliphilus JW-YL-7 = DSM 7308 TaxID=1121328 RepID=A0A150FNJ9_CLOPD|nr:Monosaccharide-transporting ATPase [[Clostridium] paradoxum JW-YL-7 = DSM 7308]SHK91587.1 amino acid/amide ABC transporter ATP-binding protein 1, HAAT family (TC 3.A.1.4.-) [[Clostridium] paradoxum JW-YL-7 = DSM 7308]
MSTILKIENITKQFGGLTAVGNVDFQVQKGSIFGLIGPNGAGKTTIFNLITGIYKITDGKIIFEDKRIDNLRPFEVANCGITRTFQNIKLFKKLTTYENILTACHNNADYSLIDCSIRNKRFKSQEENLRKQADEIINIMGLWDRKDDIAVNLPYGFQRRLEIGRALALKPKLLLLDEPAAGMNPEETIQLMNLIKEIRDRFDLTVIVIEHHMDLIMGICDNILVLNFGRKLAQGTPREIQENSSVVEAYLGKEDASC